MRISKIVDGNAKTDLSNRKDPGSFCGEIEQTQTFISETSFVKVLFHADNFTDQTYFSFDSRAEQQYEVYLRYGQHPELYPNRRGQVVTGQYCERIFRDCRLQTCYVQSPAYPGIYPRNLHCTYRLNTRLPFIKMYIENEEFNIDGQRCENIMTCPMRPISSGAKYCPYDYLRVYDGKDANSPVIGTFCGMGKFPYSIIGTSEDLFVEFVSSAAGPLLNTGFHFNVGNWPGHVETKGTRNGTCDWLLTADDLAANKDSEGIFLSIAHWYAPHTSCTYLIQGKPNQVVRLYFPSFRITRIQSGIEEFSGDCGESLTLYDASWPDDSRIIKTFCDTFSRPMEKHDFVSTSNSLFVRFESKTGSYAGSSLYYWAHYDFFNNTHFGTPIPGTSCDEEFLSWKQAKGYVRSPMNTLVYKRNEVNSNAIKCRYKFVTDKRIYARIIITINNINFKSNPYNNAVCSTCWDDRLDKMYIWEPSILGAKTNASSVVSYIGSGATCLCKNTNTTRHRFISQGENVNVELSVESSHSATSYFKHAPPLFELEYEFVHGYVEAPRYVHCIWEIRVSPNRDVWIQYDNVRFVSKDCRDGTLSVFLPSQPTPHLTVCGHNVSALKTSSPIAATNLRSPALSTSFTPAPHVRIQFIGPTTPAKAAFKIVWTELLHLPRNQDGTVMTSRLIEDGTGDDNKCEFLCPGDKGVCIPARLVCNGVVNCPGTIHKGNGSSYLSAGDEALDLCATRLVGESANWRLIAVGACGGALLALVLIALIVRCCCRCCFKRADDEDDY
ncbi:hypothetical protein M8J76_007896 [Diaphorina citri]|nr:hypothetical protein M8J76_007896 [Diaphorina citri]